MVYRKPTAVGSANVHLCTITGKEYGAMFREQSRHRSQEELFCSCPGLRASHHVPSLDQSRALLRLGLRILGRNNSIYISVLRGSLSEAMHAEN